MGDSAASETSAWAALKRRKLVQWALAYVALAWVLLQAASLFAGVYGWPAPTLRIVTGVLLVGLPVSLVLAWYHGERGHQRINNTELLIVTLLLAVGGGLLWFAERGEKGTAGINSTTAVGNGATNKGESFPSAPVAKSIAVLPFSDMSPGKDQEYFSDGMAEEILNALARVKDLKVAGRTSSFQYKGRNADLRAIGRELGVANILEGSVRKQGEKVRITAQLIQAEDGFHLWSESYDGELSDVFALQERIARAITDQLQVVLQGTQNQQLVPVATANAEAYTLFLRATAQYNRREDDLGPAVAALQEALRLDPKFARAQARIAAIHVVWTERDDRLELSESHARKAIALDPGLAEPWAVLARGYGEQRRFVEAREAYGHALELEPDDPIANYWYGVLLIMTGHGREGRALLDRALEIEPMQPNAQLWVGLEAAYAGDLDAAQRAVQRAEDMGLSFAAYGQSEVALARGDYARAVEIIAPRIARRMGECGVGADDARRMLAGSLGDDSDERRYALEVIERCLANHPDPTPFWTVKSLLYMDEPARVIDIAQARLTNNETFLFQLLWSPYGESTRRLPEFAEFVRKAGLADVWEEYGAPERCKRRGARDYACE